MSKQTAVDIAFEKLANQGILVTKDYKNLVAYREAKQMEKEQIIDAFGIGCQVESKRLIGYHDMAEQHYNETYGGQDESKG